MLVYFLGATFSFHFMSFSFTAWKFKNYELLRRRMFQSLNSSLEASKSTLHLLDSVLIRYVFTTFIVSKSEHLQIFEIPQS